MSCDSASGSGCLIVGIEVSRWKSVARAQRQWWKVGVMVAEKRRPQRPQRRCVPGFSVDSFFAVSVRQSAKACVNAIVS